MREGVSPSPSPLLHRAMPNVRAITKTGDAVDGSNVRTSTPPTSPQLGKLIIRAARSPDRAASPDYVRTPATVVGPTNPSSPHRQFRGAYVNVQGDEGKTSSTDEHRDCTGRTDRLEAPRTAIIPALRTNDECTRQPPGSPTLALASSNKLLEANESVEDVRICHNLQVDRQTKRKSDHDENYPPAQNGDAHETSVCTIAPSKVNHSVVFNSMNSRLDFEKSGPKSLKVTGNTPKFSRKLLVSNLDTPSFCRKRSDYDSQNVVEENAINDIETSDKNTTTDSAELDNQSTKKKSDSTQSGDRTDRKVKRSESYRMANSPIMFIKKFSANSQAEKSSKICRTPSEELQEELLRERINYPETVSSPEPRVSNNMIFDAKLTTTSIPIQSMPASPRPRASDLEPARVLKYSSNDTEIW